MIEALAAIAPGKPLREGLDRILQANMGALVVVGDGPEVLAISTGGFLLDAEYTPQRLSELAKMDGAIVLESKATRIARANVHLLPDPSVPTTETGTRHRTAERVARHLDVPVISVSEDMSIITVYRGEHRHRVEPIPQLLARAAQALATLERYKHRLDQVSTALTHLEAADQVTVRDVATVLQRSEMVRRVAEEIEDRIVELGTEGRLVMLQLDELTTGVDDDLRLVGRDYAAGSSRRRAEEPRRAERRRPGRPHRGCCHAAPRVERRSRYCRAVRGYRLLRAFRACPRRSSTRSSTASARSPKLLAATVDELDAVAGVGAVRAKAISEGLTRQAESTALQQ